MKGVLKANTPSLANRRSFLKRIGISLLGLTAMPTLYSLLIERFWIEINTININFPRLPSAFSGLKLVHISDIHFGYYYTTKNLQNLVQQINSLKPDIICFTGDLVDEDVNQLNQCIPILEQLSASLGKIAVLGNHDYRIGQPDKVIETLEKSGFILLRNRNCTIQRLDSQIHIAGVDDLFAKPDLQAALAGISNNEFTILLAHEPDITTIYKPKLPIDLQLSGHSHGGQIRIPYYGPLYRPDGAKIYDQGLYTLPFSNTLLYVNSGVGTTFAPIRFDCRPEITVFIL